MKAQALFCNNRNDQKMDEEESLSTTETFSARLQIQAMFYSTTILQNLTTPRIRGNSHDGKVIYLTYPFAAPALINNISPSSTT